MQHLLIETLFSKTVAGILSVLFNQEKIRLHAREIARKSGIAIGSVQRDLKKLTNAGLLIRTKEGQQVYYTPDQKSPIYDELLKIVSKTMGIIKKIQVALQPLNKNIIIAMVYGSVARGEASERSDLDLLIIGDTSFSEIVSATSQISEETGWEINPIVLSASEYKNKMESGNHFLKSLKNEKTVYLIGNSSELERLEK